MSKNLSKAFSKISLDNMGPMANYAFTGILAVAVTLYGPRLSPQLPDFIRSAFNKGWFRFALMALIVFLGSNSIKLSMLVAILFLLIITTVNHMNIRETFKNDINEYYSNYNLFDKDGMEHFVADLEGSSGGDRCESLRKQYNACLKGKTGEDSDEEEEPVARPATGKKGKKGGKKVVVEEESDSEEEEEKPRKPAAGKKGKKGGKKVSKVVEEEDESDSEDEEESIRVAHGKKANINRLNKIRDQIEDACDAYDDYEN